MRAVLGCRKPLHLSQILLGKPERRINPEIRHVAQFF
jgi:hypothetical protein